MENKEFVTLNEMAAQLKVKRSWLYFRTKQRGEGAIPRIKMGKYLRFKPGGVMAWVIKQYGDTN